MEHRLGSPTSVRCAVITVSDTRTAETDTGGKTLCEGLVAAGHTLVARHIVADEPAQLEPLVRNLAAGETVDAVLLTGGTGISSRDQTYETITRLFTKTLPGYGELFRQLSFAEIGAAAMLSRATGGLVGKCVVLTMPGSPAAVKLALSQLILPELGHLTREARR